MQTSRIATIAGLITCVALNAFAGDLIDTRLSFVFADDNVLAKAGETTPNSPNARFGAGNQNTQFYDNFNTRFTGFETLSHIVLYKKANAFFEGLTTEASMNVLVLERSSGGIDLRDDSSYITLTYRPSTWGEKEGISLTGFPVSADRFRLGYAYRVTWGGSGIFTNRAAAAGVPGVKLQVTRNRWYAFAGAKTALVLNDLILEQETLYGALGGLGFDFTDSLRLEANGGYFQKGLVPGLAAQGIEAKVNSAGVSAQAVYHVGVPVGTSVDLRLYRNDPEQVQKFFAPELYPGGFSYSVQLEGDLLWQTLENPDRFAATTPQQARAAALQVRSKWNYLRAHALGLYRTISYIQFDTPGFPPFKDFPKDTKQKPELFLAIGLDYHFPSLHLTPGFIAGAQQPASFNSPVTILGGTNGPASLSGGRTVVIRDVNQISVLPTGVKPTLIWSAKFTTRWDISESVSAVGEVFYTRDENRTTFRDDVTGVAEPTLEKPDAIGFNAMIQARF